MADKKIKYDDIFDGELFEKAIKGADQLLKSLDKLESQFKDILSATKELSKTATFDNVDDIRKTEEAIKKNTEAVKALDEIEKQREKLLKRLAVATDERAKANASLRLQISEANRQAKENAKIEGDLGPYKAKSAQLNKLRLRYKDLASAEKATTKEAKDLLKEIQALDKELKDIDRQVGQNQRNVGNYADAVDRLKGKLDGLQKIGIVTALLQLVNTFKQSENGAATFEKALLQVTVRLTVFVDIISNAIKESDSFFDVFDNLQKGIKTFNDRVDSAIASGEKLVDSELETIRTTAALQIQLAKLIKTQADFEIAADDNTLSLEAQRKALDELEKATDAVLKKELQIAQAEVAIAKERRDQSAALRSDGKADAESQQALADAILNRANAEAELTRFQADTAKRRREIARDSAELELDILIDASDNLKTIRERIIADETLNVRTRRELLKQTVADIDSAFNEQIAVIEKLTGITLDSNDLIAESDTKVLNEKVKALKLDEITQNRLLEIIRERRTAQQDLAESNRDLAESEKQVAEQAALNELQLRALFDLQQEGVVLQEVLNKLSDDTLQLEIDNLQKRILETEKGSNKIVELQNELNEKLLQQQTERIQKQNAENEKARQDQLAKEKAFADATVAVIKELSERRLNAQEEAIDRELQAVERRQEALRELANRGVEDAADNLALQERRQAEIERRREQQRRQSARLELGISALETYTNKVQAGDQNALQNTITDISELQAFIASLPAFFEGTENVADSIGAPDIAGRDGYIIRADGSERIMTGEQNKLVGNMSNDQLAMLAFQHRVNPRRSEASADTISYQLLSDIKKSIDQKPVYLGRDYSATERAVVDVIEKKGAVERRHKKTGGFWGK